MSTSREVLEYINKSSDELFVWRMRYSRGVMTGFDVGPYQVRWDRINTAALRKYISTGNKSAVRKHVVKYLTKYGDSLFEGDIIVLT